MSKSKTSYMLPAALVGVVMLIFWVVYPVFPNSSTSMSRVLPWMMDAWRGDFMHGWAVPVLFVAFISMAWKTMKAEPVRENRWGLLVVALGLLFFVASVRTLQPRIALFGLPFFIFGSVLYVCAWKASYSPI